MQVTEEKRMRKAIVMAGGQGSRLQPLTLTRSKPLVPVANRPVLAYILEWLRGHGFSEVLVTLHYGQTISAARSATVTPWACRSLTRSRMNRWARPDR